MLNYPKVVNAFQRLEKQYQEVRSILANDKSAELRLRTRANDLKSTAACWPYSPCKSNHCDLCHNAGHSGHL